MSNPVTNKTAFDLQTDDWMGWNDHCRLTADLQNRINELTQEIATLQPGYVAPEPPKVEERIEEAIAAVLTEDEKIIYAKEITDAKAHFCAVAVEESKPVEEKPIDIEPVNVVEP